MNKRIEFRCKPLLAFAAFCVIAPGILAGCVTPTPSESFPPPADTARLELQPGDVVEFSFPYWPELNDTQTVRPDGKISLQLVNEVQAQGRTPEELRQDLLVKYEDKILDPEISVSVEALDSRRVYVGGEVVQSGVIPLTHKMTVVDAIVQAGGFENYSARKTQILLVRERDGVRYAKVINVRKNLSQPEHTPVYLEPRDVVYVPRTAIDRVDQWVEQYINRIIPDNVNWTLLTETESNDTPDTAATFAVP